MKNRGKTKNPGGLKQTNNTFSDDFLVDPIRGLAVEWGFPDGVVHGLGPGAELAGIIGDLEEAGGPPVGGRRRLRGVLLVVGATHAAPDGLDQVLDGLVVLGGRRRRGRAGDGRGAPRAPPRGLGALRPLVALEADGHGGRAGARREERRARRPGALPREHPDPVRADGAEVAGGRLVVRRRPVDERRRHRHRQTVAPVSLHPVFHHYQLHSARASPWPREVARNVSVGSFALGIEGDH